MNRLAERLVEILATLDDEADQLLAAAQDYNFAEKRRALYAGAGAGRKRAVEELRAALETL